MMHRYEILSHEPHPKKNEVCTEPAEARDALELDGKALRMLVKIVLGPFLDLLELEELVFFEQRRVCPGFPALSSAGFLAPFSPFFFFFSARARARIRQFRKKVLDLRACVLWGEALRTQSKHTKEKAAG